MQGLLNAVAPHGFRTHLTTWHGPEPDSVPIELIRQGWDIHVRWEIENPDLYSIAPGGPSAGRPPNASTSIDAILMVLITRAAEAGYLTGSIEQAVNMLRAVGTGVVFTLITMPEGRRDLSLS